MFWGLDTGLAFADRFWYLAHTVQVLVEGGVIGSELGQGGDRVFWK